MHRIQIIIEYQTSEPHLARDAASQAARAVELADWQANNVFADVAESESVDARGDLIYEDGAEHEDPWDPEGYGAVWDGVDEPEEAAE